MNEHGLTRENLLSTFPAALAKDPAVYALAEAAADLLAGRLEEIKMVNLYAQIDRLEEPLLDILAQDFKVDWWNPGYTLEEKRRTLRDSWKVHRTLGTKAAVVTAISAIYPKTDVQEWFEYGGEPFHFKIKIDLTGEKMNGERPKQVLERVNFYKSLRSHLDSITASSALEPVRICTAALFYKTRSRSTLPLLEPELPGCSIFLGAVMGRGRSRTTLPMLDVTPPEMRGSIRLGTHTGTYMRTCLPVLEDFTSVISMNCKVGLSAGFISRSKTKLPEWEENTMSYGSAVTKKGRELFGKILAYKLPLTITRIMMGQGLCPDNIHPADLEDLIEPVASGTSTEPVYESDTVKMTLQYRSDLNGGLEHGFWIREFGVFARDLDGADTLIFYGSLGEYTQWVSAQSTGGIDVREYDIAITVGEGAVVVLDYSPDAFMTAESVKELCTTTILPQFLDASNEQIQTHNLNENAHPFLQSLVASIDARLSLLELMYNTDVSGNPFTVTFDNLAGLSVAGVYNAAQKRIEF